jgi:hypothetical protein
MSDRRCKLLLGGLTLAALLPFLNKAYDIDDPLFLWMGQQIIRHPFDPAPQDLCSSRQVLENCFGLEALKS